MIPTATQVRKQFFNYLVLTFSGYFTHSNDYYLALLSFEEGGWGGGGQHPVIHMRK